MKSPRLALTFLLAAGCSDPPHPPPDGVVVPEGECGHALYVISSDRQSSTVAIVGYDGEVLAPIILSSGSEEAGLSVPLSGDVTAPTSRTTSGSIVLLDRYPASVITLLDPVHASVEGQVSVQSGFSSNPQDILEIDGRIFVARYESNPDPGAEAFDEGSDVVVVDPQAGEIVDRIDLSPAMEGAPAGILPRPARLLRSNDRAYVLLAALSADFKTGDDGRVTWFDIETGEIGGHLVLEGLAGCTALAIAPSGARLAVGCSGTFLGPTDQSGVVVLRTEGDGIEVERVFAASELGDEPVGLSLAFTSDDVLLAGTFGELGATGESLTPDRLLELTIATGESREILRTDKPFSIGDVRCEAACGVCFVADADRGVVHRAVLDEDGRVDELEAISLDDGIGLPPRYLGAY